MTDLDLRPGIRLGARIRESRREHSPSGSRGETPESAANVGSNRSPLSAGNQKKRCGIMETITSMFPVSAVPLMSEAP